MYIFFFCVIFAGSFILFAFYKAGRGFASPTIECPVCGRNVKLYGNATRCYKCKSKLIKHANGNYIKG
jgi:Zn finger protein HypA/HybF involved in hydrogenase expression